VSRKKNAKDTPKRIRNGVGKTKLPLISLHFFGFEKLSLESESLAQKNKKEKEKSSWPTNGFGGVIHVQRRHTECDRMTNFIEKTRLNFETFLFFFEIGTISEMCSHGFRIYWFSYFRRKW